MSQKELAQIISELLQVVEFIPIYEANNSDYHYLNMTPYTQEGDKSTYYAMILPQPAQEFFTSANKLLDNKVSQRQINRVITHHIEKQFPSPSEFTTISEVIATDIWEYYITPSIVYIPLQNISLEDGLKCVQIANSILYKGGKRSLFAEEVERLKEKYKDKDYSPLFGDPPTHLNFLLIKTGGDLETTRRIAWTELRNSLMVLRFISPSLHSVQQGQEKGYINNFIRYNAAISVQPYNRGTPYILQIYETPHRPYSQMPIQKTKHFYLKKHLLEHSKKYYGLDDLNLHFQQDYPISQRIVRALEFYDNGLQAWDTWEAVYRYAIAINIVLPKSGNKEKNIRSMIESIIFKGDYIGKISENDNENATYTWKELTNLIGDTIKRTYKQRGQILHSNDLIIPNDSDTEFSRRLAWNIIRLMARFAHENNWKTDKEAKEWFDKVEVEIKQLEKDDEDEI